MFALKKFHKQIYGRDHVIMTDYTPLVSLFGELKGNQKGNIKCYVRERANTKQPFWTVITFLTSVVY